MMRVREIFGTPENIEARRDFKRITMSRDALSALARIATKDQYPVDPAISRIIEQDPGVIDARSQFDPSFLTPQKFESTANVTLVRIDQDNAEKQVV